MKITEFLKTIEGLSPNTIRNYSATLYQMEREIKGEEPTDQEVEKFLKAYSPSSLHRHKAAIKAYLEFKGRAWPFNARKFRAPYVKPMRYLTPETVRDMIEKTENEDDHMFVLSLFTLGCRVAELMSIDVDAINTKGISMQTKGGGFKLKPIKDDFHQIITGYINKRKIKGIIFKENYAYYYKLIRTLGEQCGHPEASPHMIRHARALDLLHKGMPLAFVQQFLGHVNINTTARYLLVDSGDLGKVLNEYDKE